MKLSLCLQSITRSI